MVDQLAIVETPLEQDLADRSIDINLQLLGAYHDGKIQLSYQRVRTYNLVSGSQKPFEKTSHGDCIIDEIRLADHDGYVEHEITFWHDARWLIQCADIQYEWIPSTGE